MKLISFPDLCLFLKKELETKEVILAIDGHAGSLKTTIATMLEKEFNASVFHCDDFYLPKKDKTVERMATPGGNIDYERMEKEVIRNLSKDVFYIPFSCKTQTKENGYTIQHQKLTIVEGSYALHPYFGHYYNYSLFCDITTDCQKERILQRNGIDAWKMFEEIWIPLENTYFTHYKIKENADFSIETTKGLD